MEPRHLEEIAASVVLAIAVIVVVARFVGLLLRRVRQPSVVAEILAGVALGPSLLGLLPGDPTAWLFPLDTRPYLSVIAGLALIIFMFIVGLELSLELVRGKGRLAVTISVSSVALPFALGSLLALWLHKTHSTGAAGENVKLLPFMLFIGAAMSVTAFPVLARILTERSMHRTPTGVLALACAAVDDVLAWIMLAVVLAVIRSSGLGDLLILVAESVTFVLLMFTVVRPRLRLLVTLRKTAGRLTPDVFAIVLVGVLLCSYITDRIGIHAIFGAFLFGAVMPRQGAEALSHEILERIEQMTVLLLLPVFFITTGLNVDIKGLGSQGLLELGAVLLVACVGKFFGASVAARLSGVHTRRASAIGVLMNTRGLTELVILNIGLGAGVLDRRLFTVMVIMAITTTVITEPLLRVIYPPRIVAREIARAERAALHLSADFRVVAAVGEDGAESTVDLAVTLLGDEPSSEVVISRLTSSIGSVEVGAGLGAGLAAIASSFEGTQELARRAEARGATAVVRSQFSDEVAADLCELLSAAEADVLVFGREDPGLPEALFGVIDCAVVWVPHAGARQIGAASSVRVSPGTDDDGLAAVEQAVRAALRIGVELVLVDSDDRRGRRRIERLQRQLAAVDLLVTTVSEPAIEGIVDDALEFVGWASWRKRPGGAPGGAGPLVVRGAPDDHGERLITLLTALSQRAAKKPQGAGHS
jgi:Kef-type K+ transport system membrane component KefB